MVVLVKAQQEVRNAHTAEVFSPLFVVRGRAIIAKNAR